MPPDCCPAQNGRCCAQARRKVSCTKSSTPVGSLVREKANARRFGSRSSIWSRRAVSTGSTLDGFVSEQARRVRRTRVTGRSWDNGWRCCKRLSRRPLAGCKLCFEEVSDGDREPLVPWLGSTLATASAYTNGCRSASPFGRRTNGAYSNAPIGPTDIRLILL